MNTTELIRPTAYERQTADDMLTDVVTVIDTVAVAGPPVLAMWAGTVLFALMVAAAALVTLAGAIFAALYLLFRHLCRHRVRRATGRMTPQRIAVESQRAIA